MGYSTSASTLIIILAVLMTASAITPTVVQSVADVSQAHQTTQNDLLDQQNTNFEIVNATYNTTTDALTVNLTNTGTTTLTLKHTDLLADGTYVSSRTTSIDGNSARTIWASGETVVMNTTRPSAPSRIQVTSPNGVSRTAPVEVVP